MGFLSDVMTDKRPASDDNETQVRHRARRRLIGAGVLLAIGVIGFPLLFETKPRPVPADVPAVQASRDRPVAAASPAKVVERAAAATSAASAVPAASTAATPAASAPALSAQRAPDARREIPIPAPPPADAVRVAQDKEKAERERAEKASAEKASAEKQRLDRARVEQARVEQARVEQARVEQARVEQARVDKERLDKERAERTKAERAAREAKTTAPSTTTAAATTTSGRFVVQVGAYASDTGVRDVRNRLDRVGLKSHTQVVRSGGGSTTRVRTGPYASRQEAEKAADKARSIGLSPSIVPVVATGR